jgi:hypothetical protein
VADYAREVKKTLQEAAASHQTGSGLIHHTRMGTLSTSEAGEIPGRRPKGPVSAPRCVVTNQMLGARLHW